MPSMNPMTPEHLFDLITLSEPRISPDGQRVAFVTSQMDEDSNTYRSGIWMVSTDGDEALPFTSGAHRENKPRWSPDGTKLAFVSHKEKKKCELNVIPTAGGESREICSLEEEIEEIAWSPDGTKIAFLARARNEDRYGKEEEKDQPPRRIDRLSYRLDNVGWTIDRPTQLWVVGTEEEDEPKQLTSGFFPLGGASWSPDGKKIAIHSGRHATWDFDLATDIYLVPSRGGKPTKITRTGSMFSNPSFSPDGSSLASLIRPQTMNSPQHARVAVIDVQTKKVNFLTEELDRNAAPFATVRAPVWLEGDLYFGLEDSGNTHLFRVRADGDGKPELLIGGERQVVAYDVSDRWIAFVATTPTKTTELFIAGLDGAGETQLTDFDRAFSSKVKLTRPRRFTATSTDGSEVEAWVMPPAGLEKGKKYPALLNIHGGPFTQYGNGFFDEFQVYTGAGYAVIYSNPRGSSGYSEAWGRAIRGPNATDPGSGWGGVDYEDLMSVVDAAIKRFPFIDADRLGVLGGSYGGYMTSWIVGHTNRFKAACSERACNNMYTMTWTSDIGHFFQSYVGPSYLEDPDEYLRQSPITYAENIETPLLILHSEKDLRCPIEQGEQLFVALKMRNKPVEFARFPGSSHELTRSGSPYHRTERFKIILEFFDRHLK